MTTAYTNLAYTSNIRNTKFHELEIFFSLLFSLNEYMNTIEKNITI